MPSRNLSPEERVGRREEKKLRLELAKFVQGQKLSAGLPGGGEEARRDTVELRRSSAGCAAPLIGEGARSSKWRSGGLGRPLRAGGAACCTLPERWRGSTLGLRDPDFLSERKSPTGFHEHWGEKSWHPGRALYESDFTSRPRHSYKLRAADGAHQRDIGEDIRLAAKITGAQWTTSSSSAKRSGA
ncbi:hypothetical protein NDU88_003112 [Pleurodeles waltl]|uniref:Uncharacterized protein n=1 Tax=Pleurodeles waltl TaxID=8319 RepID=A0AAV7W593_PLEWA|nr:hypothetical protein NDU88_003112 [Pleurodeles waltl]